MTIKITVLHNLRLLNLKKHIKWTKILNLNQKRREREKSIARSYNESSEKNYKKEENIRTKNRQTLTTDYKLVIVVFKVILLKIYVLVTMVGLAKL